MDTNTDTRKSRNGTRLNKAFRNGIGINARRQKSGCPVVNSAVITENGDILVRYVDGESANGGNVTPFNIQCTCDGACAIRKIIFDGNGTIVIFQDGDRVNLHRHDDDKDDPVTAVLWALGQKVFGTELSRQINRALKYRSCDIETLRAEKKLTKETKALAMPQLNG